MNTLFRKIALGITTAVLGFGLVANSLASDNTTQQALINPVVDSKLSSAQPPAIIPPAPNINAAAYVVMDANSGKIIASKNPDARRAPASLTKLMTLYIASSALARGQIKLTDNARISEDAWKTGGSRMFVKVGTDVPIQDLIDGIIIASGNDACVAIADYIAGNQDSFANLMNQTAARLGMSNSHFIDPTGLPAPTHYSTASDLATLAYHIINDFPQYYGWYKQKWITWNGIRQPNRNRLLWRDPTVDGLKTGHTDDAGYCLIASGVQNNMRLIVVVLGAPSDTDRANDTQALLNWGYRFYESHELFSANTPITNARVYQGKDKFVPIGLAKPLYVSTPIGQYKYVKATMTMQKQLRAPIQEGSAYGRIDVTLNDQLISSTPLVALKDSPKGGFWSRMYDRIALIF